MPKDKYLFNILHYSRSEKNTTKIYFLKKKKHEQSLTVKAVVFVPHQIYRNICYNIINYDKQFPSQP